MLDLATNCSLSSPNGGIPGSILGGQRTACGEREAGRDRSERDCHPSCSLVSQDENSEPKLQAKAH